MVPRWGFWARFKAQWKRDVAVAKKQHLPWWAILCVIVGGFLLCELLERFGGANFVFPVVVSLMSLPYVVWFKWELRRELWFRVVMGSMLAVHVELFVWIPWTYEHLPGRTVSGAGVLDVCLMLAVVDGAGVYLNRKKKVVTRQSSTVSDLNVR